ncbi:Apoptosis facilitator Bcl-2-like protein 14 [Liparis tanakae]|uniref:Apoptosis facilitator Bcl-2-like protein 14 n=1 Tax=Liparis tanakae TaxID=230148 RepID=A0A4Z2F721_9TELE|nr:Apoptosis facilitator Bcl-2-like protein 14 [Liparis tanakae]
MANGHVEIHDPFLNHRDPERTSDSDDMEDSVELRLMMAYARRRRPQRGGGLTSLGLSASGVKDGSGALSPLQMPDQAEKEEEKEMKKRRKKKKRRLSMKGWRRNIFSCIKPQTDDGEPRQMIGEGGGAEGADAEGGDAADRCGPLRVKEIKEEEEEKEKDKDEDEELNKTAHKLTQIADEIPLMPPDVEADSPDDVDVDVSVEKLIGLLLRGSGDRLNEKELKDHSIASELFWDYSFFRQLMTALLTRLGLRSRHPDSPGPKASPKTQIAVACEVTSRLSDVSSLPRNRLLDHGARYLQHYYSPWALQHGGYVRETHSDAHYILINI